MNINIPECPSIRLPKGWLPVIHPQHGQGYAPERVNEYGAIDPDGTFWQWDSPYLQAVLFSDGVIKITGPNQAWQLLDGDRFDMWELGLECTHDLLTDYYYDLVEAGLEDFISQGLTAFAYIQR